MWVQVTRTLLETDPTPWPCPPTAEIAMYGSTITQRVADAIQRASAEYNRDMSDHEALHIARASLNAAILPEIEAEMARLVTQVQGLTMEVARLKNVEGTPTRVGACDILVQHALAEMQNRSKWRHWRQVSPEKA